MKAFANTAGEQVDNLHPSNGKSQQRSRFSQLKANFFPTLFFLAKHPPDDNRSCKTNPPPFRAPASPPVRSLIQRSLSAGPSALSFSPPTLTARKHNRTPSSTPVPCFLPPRRHWQKRDHPSGTRSLTNGCGGGSGTGNLRRLPPSDLNTRLWELTEVTRSPWLPWRNCRPRRDPRSTAVIAFNPCFILLPPYLHYSVGAGEEEDAEMESEASRYDVVEQIGRGALSSAFLVVHKTDRKR